MPVTIEREVKLRFDSVDAARAAIRATDATPLRCRRLQEDYLLDDQQETLRQRRCVLRVRIESGKSLLTFKGPVQHSPVKAREEVETVVGDGTSLMRCFEHLGYACGSAIRSIARSTRWPTWCSQSTRRPSACSSRSKGVSRASRMSRACWV